ncbi:Translation elongation factor 1 beta [Coemansia biformis]|uniref:Translation elongation factor 1 beta n=1 Tax=Coemansia biformis TaxID=1286918 RepID=A0A9W7YGC0_9FUNG|nr:Translation elongation factor 1 beta [Coemansia biformis]
MSVTVSTATLNAVLNGLFEDNSYVVGVEASAADAEIFQLLAAKPDAKAFPHLARWYSHIASLGDAISSLKAAEVPAAAEAEEDEDLDLFGSDDEVDEEAEKLKAQRLADYAAKKAAKGPGPAAKTTVTFEIKPWEADTDIAELEKMVKGIEMDGLVWAVAGKHVPIAYGIKKLQINAVIEDAKIPSMEDITDKIEAFDDFVQSVDILALQKI